MWTVINTKIVKLKSTTSVKIKNFPTIFGFSCRRTTSKSADNLIAEVQTSSYSFLRDN